MKTKQNDKKRNKMIGYGALINIPKFILRNRADLFGLRAKERNICRMRNNSFCSCY